jgi:hypothetical protein
MADAKAKKRMYSGPRVSVCANGHEYTPENTAVNARSGKRRCIACGVLNSAKRRKTPEGREYMRKYMRAYHAPRRAARRIAA